MKRIALCTLLLFVFYGCTSANTPPAHTGVQATDSAPGASVPAVDVIATPGASSVPPSATTAKALDMLEIEEDIVVSNSRVPNTTDPLLSDTNIFRNMQYVALVKDEAGYYTDGGDAWYDFSFLGGEFSTYQKGKNAYESLNRLYYSKRSVDHDYFFPRISLFNDAKEFFDININPQKAKSFADPALKGLYSLFFERHIVLVSSDASRVLCEAFTHDWRDPNLYEVFENSNMLHSFEAPPYSVDMPRISGNIRFLSSGKRAVNIDTAHQYSISNAEIVFNANEDEYMFVDAGNEAGKYTIKIASLESQALKFSQSIQSENIPQIKFFDDNQILFSIYTLEHPYSHYYSLDRISHKLSYIATMPEGVVSPDGKYLIYTSLQPPYEHDQSGFVELGYYIYNFSSEQTVFYSTNIRLDKSVYAGVDDVSHIVCWVDQKKLSTQLSLNN